MLKESPNKIKLYFDTFLVVNVCRVYLDVLDLLFSCFYLKSFLDESSSDSIILMHFMI
jgi:hypothetical protein